MTTLRTETTMTDDSERTFELRPTGELPVLFIGRQVGRWDTEYWHHPRPGREKPVRPQTVFLELALYRSRCGLWIAEVREVHRRPGLRPPITAVVQGASGAELVERLRAVDPGAWLVDPRTKPSAEQVRAWESRQRRRRHQWEWLISQAAGATGDAVFLD